MGKKYLIFLLIPKVQSLKDNNMNDNQLKMKNATKFAEENIVELSRLIYLIQARKPLCL